MPIKTVITPAHEQAGYVTWDKTQGSFDKAINQMGAALETYPLGKTRAALSNYYKNIDGATSVRSGFTKNDYDYFRPSEMVPKDHRQIIKVCLDAYESIDVVRHVIDLMSEFASQGIRLVHPNKSVEKFFNSWFAKVNGQERSERFVNTLYKCGNVIINIKRGKIPQSAIDSFKKTVGKEDLSFTEIYKPEKRVIPAEYVFIHPGIVGIENPSLAIFTGDRKFYIQPSASNISFINNQIDNLSPDNLFYEQQTKNIKLKPENTAVYYYKKDDWKLWGLPMTYAILDDIIMLRKLRLADRTTLDGIISHVRMWKLGNLDAKILPNAAAVNRLTDILLNHVGGGTMDLVWGPDIELIETKTDLSGSLGKEKYAHTMSSIYVGLGIPPALVSGGEGAGGATSNYMSIRAFIERLNYGRMLLIDFWTKEVQAVTKAMGFRTPPTILFDTMNLADESNEKNLWIQLADRNILSWESVQEKFGRIPEIEFYRTTREQAGRDKGKLPPQIGPFAGTDNASQIKKIAMQTGVATPSEVGVELDEKAPGEASMLDQQQKTALLTKPPGQPGQGRPPNSKDKNIRKKKVLKTSTKAFFETVTWANQAQDIIAEIINPQMLKFFNKKNMRSLTTAETKQADKMKLSIFFDIDPLTNITEELIGKIMAKPLEVYNTIDDIAKELINEIHFQTNSEPTVEHIKTAHSYAYALFKGDFDVENSDND